LIFDCLYVQIERSWKSIG